MLYKKKITWYATYVCYELFVIFLFYYIQHPAYMSSATIQLLRKDAFQWLQQQIATVCKQLNIVLIPESTTDVSVSVNQQQFISHTADTLQCNIVRECLIKSDHESFEINWWNSDNGLSCQNDVIGDGMLKICLQSPASFITRKSQFIGYGLPNKLRPWTWKYLLELHFSNQQVSRHPVDYKYVPHKFMEKFAELRITKPVQNSMDDLISKTTLQVQRLQIVYVYATSHTVQYSRDHEVLHLPTKKIDQKTSQYFHSILALCFLVYGVIKCFQYVFYKI